MIKLIDYKDFEQREIYISKSSICRMKRKGNDGLTTANIICYGECYFSETPEEILAMPDIEEGNKTIDWEQRRYEIAKDIMAAIYTRPDVKKSTLLNISQTINVVDALISELKKGQDNE